MKAEEIAKALRGQRTGNGWTARCPAHEDRNPSFSIRDADSGKVLVHCHAGCAQESVIAALRGRGLWDDTSSRQSLQKVAPRRPKPKPDRHDTKRTRTALGIWEDSRPAEKTLVETYLNSRGIKLPPGPSLRFHPSLKHPQSGRTYPSMVANVVDSRGCAMGIHRTFLRHDGTGKADVSPNKMMLGPTAGGAVRLGGAGSKLLVGEGIETCLSAMQATGTSAWAALSTSGLRTLELPQDIREVIVLADGDAAGEAAAQHCARRWKRESRRVRIARPPIGMDFNDMLMRATREKEFA